MINTFFIFSGAKHLERTASENENHEEAVLGAKLLTLHQEIQDLKLAESRLDELIGDCQGEMKHCSAAKHVNKYVCFNLFHV